MRLNKFKKENFIYSAANKKLSLGDKYKPIISPSRGNANNGFLNRVNPSPSVPSIPTSNIISMEEKKTGSNIPTVSHTERMRNNMQKLNLLSVNNSSSKIKAPLKGILKNTTNASTVSPITDQNLKANTLANSMSMKKMPTSETRRYY